MDATQIQQTESITSMDTKSLVEVQSSSDADQLQQTGTITCMDLSFYDAAVEGKSQVFKDAHDPLDLLLTPNKNTILHIYITSLSKTKKELKTKFVEEILDIKLSLLQKCNAKGETPLHIAARYGLLAIVEVLIRRAKPPFIDLESQAKEATEMLRMTNQEGDTALHEAVRYNHLKVVRLLLKEDPCFSYSANKAGETLLYMAVERGFNDVMFEILNTYTSPAYTGPLGRTALHAAVFWDDEELIITMSQKIGVLTSLADEKGWTPLHLAAYCNHWRVVKALLKDYRQMAYMKDMKGRTALHIAAYAGNHMVVRNIISRCPDCCELVDKKGWNAFHFSVEGKCSSETISIFLNKPFLANLLNEKDVEGNTALHHYFKSWNLSPILVLDPRVDKLAFNNQNLNITDLASLEEELLSFKLTELSMARSRPVGLQRCRRVVTDNDHIVKPENEKEKKDEGRGPTPYLERSLQAYTLVATLVATVSFAAGMAVPGGFVDQDGPDPGAPILARSAAFKAFMVTNTLAFLLSTWAVFAHAIRELPTLSRVVTESNREFLAASAMDSTLYAFVAMMLAFVTGTYAMMAHQYSDIAIAIWTVGPFLWISVVVPDYLMQTRKYKKDPSFKPYPLKRDPGGVVKR